MTKKMCNNNISKTFVVSLPLTNNTADRNTLQLVPLFTSSRASDPSEFFSEDHQNELKKFNCIQLSGVIIRSLLCKTPEGRSLYVIPLTQSSRDLDYPLLDV